MPDMIRVHDEVTLVTAGYSYLSLTGQALTMAEIGSGDISNGAITTNKIANGAVTSAKLADSYAPLSHVSDTSNPHSVTLAQLGGTTDHGELQGLGDDDHSHYLINAPSGTRNTATASNSTTVPLTLKAHASQNIDIFRVYNSSWDLWTRIDKDGYLYNDNSPTPSDTNFFAGGGAGGGANVGTYNTIIGYYTGNSAGTLGGVTALGSLALRMLSSGTNSVAVGFEAGRYYGAGSNLTSATGSIFIGTSSRAGANNSQYEIVIGYNAIGLGDNTTVIGHTTNTITGLRGQVGVNEDAPGAQLQATIGSAARIGIIVEGAAAQSANLQEWQDSASATVAAITPAGEAIVATASAGTHAVNRDLGDARYAPIAHVSDTSNPHSVTLAQVGGTLDHTGLTNIGTNTHAQIDTHIANTSNPHAVTFAQLGGTLDHDVLQGLTDDDHSQYLVLAPATVARNTITTTDNAEAGLTIKLKSGQTAYMAQFVDASDAFLLAVNDDGDLFTDKYVASTSNTLIGIQPAGQGNMTGTSSTLVGYRAGYETTTGHSNAAVGLQALLNNTEGYYNSVLGRSAGSTGTTGYQNCAVGFSAGGWTTGNNNVVFGAYSGSAIQTGSNNVICGYYSYKSTVASGGDGNVAFGHLVMRYVTGSNNIALGVSALAGEADSGQVCTGNVSLGYWANRYVGTGSNYNVAVGYHAGASAGNQSDVFTSSVHIGYQSGYTSAGDYQTMVGREAGQDCQSNYATGIGMQALETASGVRPIALGYKAGQTESGNDAIYIGYLAGSENTGNNLVAIGDLAARFHQGANSIAIGIEALKGQATGTPVTGNTNIGIGSYTLHQTTSGYYNVGIGYQALRYTTTGYSNVAIGYNAFTGNSSNAVTGSYNVVIGYSAGYFISGGATVHTNGTNSVLIGRSAYPNANGETNQIVIGYAAVGQGSNTVQLGGPAVTDTYTAGNLHAEHGIYQALDTKTADYTADGEDSILLVDASSAAVTITLPTASGIAGRTYFVKAIDATNTVTVDANGAQTIDGQLTQTLDLYDCLQLVSDGTNWVIV